MMKLLSKDQNWDSFINKTLALDVQTRWCVCYMHVFLTLRGLKQLMLDKKNLKFA